MKDGVSRQRGLAALLDALEAELLAAPAEEVGDALRDTARARDVICRELRALVSGAVAAIDDGPAAGGLPRGLDGQADLHRN